jgi:hypothetical protein
VHADGQRAAAEQPGQLQAHQAAQEHQHDRNKVAACEQQQQQQTVSCMQPHCMLHCAVMAQTTLNNQWHVLLTHNRQCTTANRCSAAANNSADAARC